MPAFRRAARRASPAMTMEMFRDLQSFAACAARAARLGDESWRKMTPETNRGRRAMLGSGFLGASVNSQSVGNFERFRCFTARPQESNR